MTAAGPKPLCFLVEELGRSGGMQVVLSHARALASEGGYAPEIVVTGAGEEPLPPEAGGVPVRALGEALGRRYAVAISTWWTTAGALFEVEADRRIAFLQSLEERFYPEEDLAERMGAAAVLALPVDFIVVAGWMRDALAALRPDARCILVRNGIDKDVFGERPPAPAGKALRVLVEGQPTLWFKAIHEAAAAVRAMAEPAELTVVAPDAAGVEAVDADRRLTGLDAGAMARLYGEHDVLLKLSRVESLGMPALEAFHVGRPCVLAPFTGHEEYAVHGDNALIAGHDDTAGTVAALDLLARDPGLRGRLAAGALATAAGWPAVEEAGRAFGQALAELEDGAPAAAGADAARHAQRHARRWAELGRRHEAQLRGLVAWRDHELADARARLETQVEEFDERLAAIADERAYRVARAVRRLLPGGRR